MILPSVICTYTHAIGEAGLQSSSSLSRIGQFNSQLFFLSVLRAPAHVFLWASAHRQVDPGKTLGLWSCASLIIHDLKTLILQQDWIPSSNIQYNDDSLSRGLKVGLQEKKREETYKTAARAHV